MFDKEYLFVCWWRWTTFSWKGQKIIPPENYVFYSDNTSNDRILIMWIVNEMSGKII